MKTFVGIILLDAQLHEVEVRGRDLFSAVEAIYAKYGRHVSVKRLEMKK